MSTTFPLVTNMNSLQAASWHCSEAVTALDTYQNTLFAGTVSGKIQLIDLNTYQGGIELDAHTSSVLVLRVCDNLLISGSGDSLIKVWAIRGSQLILLYTIYCLVDVGDIFCVEYLSECQTIYFGTQNAAIHWVKLPEFNKELDNLDNTSNASLHPAVRPNRFFDSAGPGGRLAPQQRDVRRLLNVVNQDATLIEAPASSEINFAHNGYVYTMVITKLEEKNILVTGSSDGTVKMWRLTSEGRPIQIASLNVDDSVLGMALSDSWRLYCSLESGHIVTIDLETQQIMKHSLFTNKPLLTLSILDAIYAVAGKTVVQYDPLTTASYRWDTSDEITATIALKEDKKLVTASRDGIVAIWDISLASPNVDQGKTAPVLDQSLSNDSMINLLSHLISYRSVSRGDHQYWYECRSCAVAFRDIFRQLGAEAELLRVENGNPIIYARFKSQRAIPGARVLFYGHYDVIDADAENWQTAPFRLISTNGYLYGRGVSDNKGPTIAAMYAAANLYAKGDLENDITFVIEGEEERGSFGFYETVKKNTAKFGDRFDWIIFSNSYWIDDKHPCLNYGLRGVVFFELEITNNKSDVHSGVEGGTFREPALDMVNLLSTLTDPRTGEIQIPDFKENVLPVSKNEHHHYDEIAAANPAFSKNNLISRWCAPTLTIHNMAVSGPGDASVIPGVVSARISFRIVPNQTAEEILGKTQNFIQKSFDRLNSPNRLNIRCVYNAEPWLGNLSSEPYNIMKKALTEEWGVEPLFIREGGSIPMARALEKLFDAPAAQLPCGQSSDSAHLQNERLRVTNLIAARKVFTRLFEGVRPRKSA